MPQGQKSRCFAGYFCATARAGGDFVAAGRKLLDLRVVCGSVLAISRAKPATSAQA